MIRRFITAFLQTRSQPIPPGVHFHHSDAGRAYACYNLNCDPRSVNPRVVA